jgi:D-lactate dehydrogenase
MNETWLLQLKTILTSDQLLLDAAACTSYSYDNGRHHAMPIAVALPKTTEEVQRIVMLCAAHGVPITARGRGTGTPGGAIPSPHGLVVSFERMNKIIDFCPESRYMLVEPGVINQTVQTLANSKNLLWGPDPSSQAYCTIGGNLAYNAGGPHTLKYGATRDNVLYLEAVIGNGDLIKTGFPVSKAACGYDLTRLLIGSEGTLALFTKACLKLTPMPEARTLLQVWFAHESEACATISWLMNQAIQLSALEFMDKQCLALLREHSTLSIPNNAQALLFIELDGFKRELPFYVDFLQQNLRSAIACHEAENMQQAWQIRKALSPILRNLAPYKINEDIVVPVHQLDNFLQSLEKITRAENILNLNFGHAGNGNLHVNLLLKSTDQLSAAERCLEKIFTQVIALGGTLSGEHGIGLDKKAFLTKAYSPATINLMRAIKQQFDPHQILNPDKLLANISQTP